MVSTDPVADMLTRIRNGLNVRKTSVDVPYSKIKENVAKVLQKNGFIDGVKVNGQGKSKQITIQINEEHDNPRITEIARISRPGRRIYSSYGDIPNVKRGRGIVVVSTSKGVMDGDQAKKNKIGGELICRVY